MFFGRRFIRPLVMWSNQSLCRSVPLLQQSRQFSVRRQCSGRRQSRLVRLVNLARDSSNRHLVDESIRLVHRGNDYPFTLRRGAVTVKNLLRQIQDEYKFEFSSYATSSLKVSINGRALRFDEMLVDVLNGDVLDLETPDKTIVICEPSLVKGNDPCLYERTFLSDHTIEMFLDKKDAVGFAREDDKVAITKLTKLLDGRVYRLVRTGEQIEPLALFRGLTDAESKAREKESLRLLQSYLEAEGYTDI